MTKEEKVRLVELTRAALGKMECTHTQLLKQANSCAAKFSPTNAEQFRALGEFVWCLIAVDAKSDALRSLDALCEINDEYYWMFHGMASALATRAGLHSNQKELTKNLSDAKTALAWIERDPNPKPVTKIEVAGALERFDGWIDRADGDKSTTRAIQVLTHALRALVIYQQLAKAGCEGAKSVPLREYKTRMDSGLAKLRLRLDAW